MNPSAPKTESPPSTQLRKAVFGRSHKPANCAAAWLLAALISNSPAAQAQEVEQFTVARDKDGRVGYRFPDLAQAANGDLVVVSLESADHNGGPIATIVAHTSADKGRTWSGRIVVDQASPYARNNPEEKIYWITDPRLIRLQDQTLLLAVGRNPLKRPAGTHQYWVYGRSEVDFYRSADNGRTWTGPEKSPVRGIGPGFIQLRSGVLLVNATVFTFNKDNKTYRTRLDLYRSTDNGKSWSGPATFVDDPKLNVLCEADFAELPAGEVICYIRNDVAPGKNPKGLKTISRDGGLTWSPLHGTGPWLYRGRPCAEALKDGSVLVSTRVIKATGGNDFGIYWEPAAAALAPNAFTADPPPEARWTILDRNRNTERPDWGYSGWVEFDDGSIYVVQYTNDGQPAKLTILRGYLLPKGYLGKMGRGEGPLDQQTPPDKKPRGKAAFDDADSK